MSGNLFEKYETDQKKELGGIEIPFDDSVFICRRAGGSNRLFRFSVATAADKRKAEVESADPMVVATAEDAITMEAFAESVVIGWKNVTDRAGKPWEFSKENFLDLMRSCPDVWAFLRMEARTLELFRATKTKEVAEDLGKSSAGTASGENT